jgi:hypothetical protein
VQIAAGVPELPGVLHDPPGRRGARKPRVKGKLLESNASALPAIRWHGFSEYFRMIPLLLAFFALGTLMCVLIGVDRHAGTDLAAADHDPLETWRRSPPAVELLPALKVDSDHTAAGFARGK